MHYEEKLIGNKLMYRTIPNGIWYEYSNETLTKRIIELKGELSKFRQKIKQKA